MEAAKAKVAEVLEGMQEDVKAAGGRVKELSAELRTSERDSRESTKAGARCFLPGHLCGARRVRERRLREAVCSWLQRPHRRHARVRLCHNPVSFGAALCKPDSEPSAASSPAIGSQLAIAARTPLSTQGTRQSGTRAVRTVHGCWSRSEQTCR